MIICHGSDWHGCKQRDAKTNKIISVFPDIKEEFDVFVMSGDFLPNLVWGANRKLDQLPNEKKYQEDWCHEYAEDIKKCIHNKPFLFSSGNHDFINPCNILKQHGINAIDLDNNIIDFMGYTWHGFPYIPFMGNHWNYERNKQEMYFELENMLRIIENHGKPIDILIAHCPLLGILDKVPGDNIGNSLMNSVISYKMKTRPKLYLCGHCHDNGGQFALVDGFDRTEDPMFVSNAATTYNLLDLDNLPLTP